MPVLPAVAVEVVVAEDVEVIDHVELVELVRLDVGSVGRTTDPSDSVALVELAVDSVAPVAGACVAVQATASGIVKMKRHGRRA